MFAQMASELLKVAPRAGERALAYILAFEQWRDTAKRSELAAAAHAAYTAQLSELQRAMDECWALAMSDVRGARKSLGGTTSAKPPGGMFDEKKKRKQK